MGADLELIKHVADCIAHAEGYGVLDAVPTDAKNPGDLMLGVRFDIKATHKGKSYFGSIGGITIYPKADRNASVGDHEDGFAALWREVYSIFENKSIFYHANMTVQEIADLWTKTEPEAWAKNVADGLGISTAARLNSLLV